MGGHSKYLAVVKRLQKRYTEKNGMIILSHGGRPSKYSRFENAAWIKYVLESGKSD